MTDKELPVIMESNNQPLSFGDSLSSNSKPNSLFPEEKTTISATNNNYSSSKCCNNNSSGSKKQNIPDGSSQKNSSKKAKRIYFTQREDELLINAAISYNQTSWNDIAQCIPGKTSKQCRDRWMNYLNPSLNFEPWSKQEDNLLTSLVNIHGTHWTKMKQYFPGRSNNSIKNRWYWLIKKNIGVKKINSSKNTMNHESNKSFTQKINDDPHFNSYNFNRQLNSNNTRTNNSKQDCNQNKNFYYLLNQKSSKQRRYSKKSKSNNKDDPEITERRIGIDQKNCILDDDSVLSLKDTANISDIFSNSFDVDDYTW